MSTLSWVTMWSTSSVQSFIVLLKQQSQMKNETKKARVYLVCYNVPELPKSHRASSPPQIWGTVRLSSGRAESAVAMRPCCWMRMEDGCWSEAKITSTCWNLAAWTSPHERWDRKHGADEKMGLNVDFNWSCDGTRRFCFSFRFTGLQPENTWNIVGWQGKVWRWVGP